MIISIFKTKSIKWNLKVINNRIFLINEADEKVNITPDKLFGLLEKNTLVKNEFNANLLLVKKENNEVNFVRKDEEEYKDYLKLKDFEKKELFPGNIFLYENNGELLEYKYITTVFENHTTNYLKREEIIRNFFTYKHCLALNLRTKKLEIISTRNVIDLLENIEEEINTNELKPLIKELVYFHKNAYFLEEKKEKEQKYIIFTFNKKLTKKELYGLFEEEGVNNPTLKGEASKE